MNQLTHAFRQLVLRPGLSAIVIVMLGLGIGATTAMFSLFHTVLLQPLPVPARLVNLGAPGPKWGNTSCGVAGNCDYVFSYPMFRDLEAAQTVFTGIAGHRRFPANLSNGEQTLSGNEPIELDVTTGSGSIAVHGAPAGRARIVGRITVWRWGSRRVSDEELQELAGRLEADPPIELTGSRLRVGYIDEPELQRNVSISYEIEVPIETRVRSQTGSGAQTVFGIMGPVQASAGSGAITLDDIRGDVEARAGSGSIRADGIAGSLEAQAGSGSIGFVQTGPGDATISTGSGSSEVRGLNGALRVRSGSGSITVEGTQTGPWELDAGSGSVRLRLPSDAAFELDAEACSGAIYTDHPVTVRSGVTRGRLSGAVRGGGPLLRVRTGSGSIRIE